MNYTSPLVSVVVCTYNGADFIEDQIKSIVNQTYSNLEVIICDDNSSDRTLEVMRKVLENSTVDYRIYENPTNIGYIKNFNAGINHTRGDLIALCDQDDIWDLCKIEILVNEIGDYSLIYSDSRIINEEGVFTNQFLSDHFNMVSGQDFRKLLLNNSVSAHSLLFKAELKTVILPLPDLLFHDWWIATVASINDGIKYFEAPLTNYRVHDSNATEIKKIVDGEKKKRRKKVKKWDAFINIERHIKLVEFLIQRLPLNEDGKKFYTKYLKLVTRRNKQVVSFSNFVFWLQNYKSVLYCRKDSYFKKMRFVTRNLFGFWFKRMFYKMNNRF